MGSLTLKLFLSFFLVVRGQAFNLSTVREHCNDLYAFTGDAGFEAPTKVVNVTLVPTNSSTGVTAYCSIEAHIPSNGGQTRYVAYLPASGADWAGVLATNGCGGSCGYISLDDIGAFGSPLGIGRDLIKKGYAGSFNDMGHDNKLTNDTTSSWNSFRNNRTNEYNWAYFSTHLTTVSTKALMEFYYGQPAKRSIFRGGSTGGRQAFMAAARYPHDYDGVIAGFGAINETAIGSTWLTYLALASAYPNGTQILTNQDLKSLHSGAIAACDGNDGVSDGIIDPSYRCDFDPVQILCSNATLPISGGCLSNTAKVIAARAIYGYPSNSFSDKLIDGRMIPGSELQWGSFTSSGGRDFANSFTINAAFQTDLPLNWTINDFNWDVDPYRMGSMEDIYTTDFTGLKVFKDKGGKILQYQGWADGVVAPGWNIDLYQRTINEIGWDATTDFHRLFVYPGMSHSDTGYNLNGSIGWRIDYYDVMNRWIDSGVAPEKLVIEHWNLTTGAHMDYRPYFAYPKTPKYIGDKAGNLSDSDSWIGVIPAPAKHGPDFPWKG